LHGFEKKEITIAEVKEKVVLDGNLVSATSLEILFPKNTKIQDTLIAELKTRNDKYYLITEKVNENPPLVEKKFHDDALSFIRDFFLETKNNNAVSIDAFQYIKNLNATLKTDMSLRLFEPYRLNLFDEMEDPSDWVYNHTVNTVILTMFHSLVNDLPPQEINDYTEAAWFHDIGHAFSDPELLFSRKRLTEEQWHPLTAHPHKAYEMLKEIPVSDGVRQGVLFHHENFDESGFPTTLPYSRLPKTSRIIAMASVFENLFSAKPYRKGLGFIGALSTMFSYADTRFEYDLLSRFVRTIAKASIGDAFFYAPGQYAVTNLGEICIIRDVTRDLLKPVIDVVTEANGKIRKTFLTINLFNDYNRRLGKIYTYEQSLVVKEKLSKAVWHSI